MKSRRKFLKSSIIGASAAFAVPTIVPSIVFGKNAPSNKINIGQIGFGRIAKSHDLPETMKNDEARVIAVSDVDSKRVGDGKVWIEKYYAEKKGKKNYVDVTTYGDYRQMLENPDI
ncbi:MAG: gfo/Idh/MocA family oxidoreductase, partial [Cyclobacteriaceae bacterium]|nr:gfo/Idh/MocA family oxidoreductase [Cyclobacteriaceae bacterium]